MDKYEAALPMVLENVSQAAVDLVGANRLREIMLHRHECRQSDDPLDLPLLQQRVQSFAESFSRR